MRLAVLALTLVWVPSVASAAPQDGSAPAPSQTRPEVVGGEPSTAGTWPEVAAVFEAGQPGPACSGVLVAPNVVLTARHCLGALSEALIGATSWVERDGEVIQIVSQYAHPSLDVGALVLQRDASATPRVIASGCVLEQSLDDGADVAVVGFGATDPDAMQFSTILREGYTTVVDADCSSSAGCMSPGSELGAGGVGDDGTAVDSCNGDSGGPLYLLTEHYDYLVGTTSRAFSDASVPCSEGGIYVRPDAIIGWIEEVTSVTIPMADCNTPPDPVASTLEAESGEIGRRRIDPNDAETDNSHRYQVVTEPDFGEAGVSEDGVAFYRSFDDDFTGSDSFTVRVTDDGVPALSMEVTVEVLVEEGGGCGCRAGPGPSGAAAWLLVLGLLASRRRRS